MKLIRYGALGNEKPGLLINDKRYDVSPFGEDFGEAFFEKDGITRLSSFLAQNERALREIPTEDRWACPLCRPSKIVCIGMNYSDHAKETNAAIPTEPVIFLKASSALSGPFDAITIPKGSQKTDWEVELAVVIGKKASYVDEANAMDYIAGYMLHNDVSEREFQMERNGTWDKGKGCDTFAPMGPFMTTKDEIPDPGKLRLWLKLNGKIMQDGNTANLIFSIPFLISYTSQFMTLLPGDIISTGTPAGVGLGMNPPLYLKEGDELSLGIDGLGNSAQKLVGFGAR